MSWDEIVRNYIVRYADTIRKTTEPLRSLGVGYFSYHHVDHEGRYTVLVDRPDWAEHYVGSEFYKEDPFLRRPEVYQSGALFVETCLEQEWRDKLFDDGERLFQLNSMLTLVDRTETGVEFFGFAGNRKDSNFQKLYMNHLPLLNLFKTHYKNELKPLLNKMRQEPFFLNELKGQDFYCLTPITCTLPHSTRTKFLTALGHKSAVEKVGLLTAREKQCLMLLLQGKSAKESALELTLSSRTVESHFENIKRKMHLYTKSDLFLFSKQLEEMELLP